MVTLEVAKQGAIYHGLATLLNQPSPMMQRSKDWGAGGAAASIDCCLSWLMLTDQPPCARLFPVVASSNTLE